VSTTPHIDALLADDARPRPAHAEYPGDHTLPLRPRSASPPPPNPDAPSGLARAPSAPDRVPRLIRLSDVAPVDVSWLWQDKIPLGRITVLAGKPGDGKSITAAEITARVTCGRDWPDGSYCPSGSVLLLSAEDALDDTIRPRLDAARADVSRVVALQGVRHLSDDGGNKVDRVITLADLDIIEESLKEMPDCKLVIVDPIGSYLGGGTDSHRDNEVRALLAPLGQLASKYNVAVICVCHTRKGGATTHADDAILGSVAFSGIARSVLHVMNDPDDPEKRRKLLLPGKCNIGPRSPGWTFTVEGGPPHVVWGERVDQTADDAVQAAAKPGPPPAAKREAAEWLKAALQGGPRLAKDVQDEAKAKADIAPATLRRAQKDLGVEVDRPKNPGPWWWRLPGQKWPQVADAQEANAHPSQGREPEHLEHLPETVGGVDDSQGADAPDAQDSSPLSPVEHVPHKPKRKRKAAAK